MGERWAGIGNGERFPRDSVEASSTIPPPPTPYFIFGYVQETGDIVE